MLKDFTQHNAAQSKQSILANVWRVFQILLEYACKTEYRLITRSLEEAHLQIVEQKEEKLKDMQHDAMLRDKEYYRKLQEVHEIINNVENEKIESSNARIKMHEELMKIQRKLEEEIKLRLFFENKLNSLHHVNMTHESRYRLLEEKSQRTHD